MTGLQRQLFAVSVAVLAVLPAVPGWAGPPTDQLRQYTDHVMKILEDPALKGPDKAPERRAAVRKVANEAFDVEESARRALGRHWQGRTPAERQEFVQLFADLLERTYISKIDFYGGEKLRYISEAVDGDRAVVRANVVTRKGTEVPVETRMLARGDRWLMYDVLVENVSLVGNYRAQFDQIIRTSSYQDLVRRLRDRRSDLSTDASTRPRPANQ
jgi:phospholipid transport system substrate-binding protein